jgi:transposase
MAAAMSSCSRGLVRSVTPWCFGVEGCGSYGQGLVSYLRRHDQRVVEAGRPDRRDRRERGKSDPIDAENAARAVLAGKATGVPKTADGTSEMIREIKIARDTAVKARTQAIITLKTLIVTAPDDLRQELQPLSKARLRDRCAGLRPGKIDTPSAAAKHALRALARRWQNLENEIKDHDRLLDTLTAQTAPGLREAFGIGVDVAAEMLVLAGDNPKRIRSEAAFAKLCGASPIPASSGVTQRHRLNWGGHRQANSALYRSVIVRMRFHPPTIAYVERRTAEGKSKREIIRCLKRYLAREIYRHIAESALVITPAPVPNSPRRTRS